MYSYICVYNLLKSAEKMPVGPVRSVNSGTSPDEWYKSLPLVTTWMSCLSLSPRRGTLRANPESGPEAIAVATIPGGVCANCRWSQMRI